MSDDWVARLLGEAERPTMPADVADRLDRTVRDVVGSQLQGTDDQGEDATGHGEDAPEEAITPAVPDPAVVPAPAVVPPAAGSTSATAPLRAGGGGDGLTDGPAEDDDLAAARAARADREGASLREQRSDDQGERRRRLLSRWVPVAAGVLALGAAGVAAVNVLDGSNGSDELTSAADQAQEASAGAAAESVAPRSLVATSTEYTTADADAFAQQVRDLVDVASTGEDGAESAPAQPEAAAGAEADAGADAEAGTGASAGAVAPGSPAPAPAPADPSVARSAATASPLSDPAALTECIQAVTDGADDSAAAVDLAVVDGVESTVVVVPDPAGTSLFVYVVGPDCTGVDTQFQFFTVTP